METPGKNIKNKLYCSCNCKYEEVEEHKPLLNGFIDDGFEFINQLDNDLYIKGREFFIYIPKEIWNEYTISNLQQFVYSNFLTLIDIKEVRGFVFVSLRCNETISHFNNNNKSKNLIKEKPLSMKYKYLSFKTNKSIDELRELVENKVKELSGLVRTEGAIYIVANELGVNMEEVENGD